VVRVARHRLRILQIVEPQMQGPPCCNAHPIRADGLAIGEIERDCDLGVPIGDIQEARRFVRQQRAVLARALARNITLRDRPDAVSYRLHFRAFVLGTSAIASGRKISPTRPSRRSRTTFSFGPYGWPPKPWRMATIALAQSFRSSREVKSCMTD